ncbi:MAG: MaoC/PaaZ C-terminal domain-containing protein [Acidimicrobiales bacterium]
MIPGVSYDQRHFDDVEVGQQLPGVRDQISYRRVIMNPAATLDFFPGHHDPEYARAQGQPTIFVNTMHLLGFVDRLVSAWGGPRTFVVRRKVSLAFPVYAGDTMVGSGRVMATREDERAGRRRGLVELECVVDNQHGACCASAEVTVALPLRTADGEERPWWPSEG